jgi:hypothetical protein
VFEFGDSFSDALDVLTGERKQPHRCARNDAGRAFRRQEECDLAERVAGHFDQLLLVGPAALTADGGEFNQDAAMLSSIDTVPSARSSTAKVRPVIDRPQVLARDLGDFSTAAEAART